MRKHKQQRPIRPTATKRRDPLQVAAWVFGIAASLAKLVDVIATRWPF